MPDRVGQRPFVLRPRGLAAGGLVVLGLAATIVLGLLHGPAALGLVPLLVGAALLVVGTSRAADHGRTASRTGEPGARRPNGALVLTTALVAAATIVAAGIAQVPASALVAHELTGLQAARDRSLGDAAPPDGTAPDGTAPDGSAADGSGTGAGHAATPAPDPSTVHVSSGEESGESGQADCAVAIGGTAGQTCRAWTLRSAGDCEAKVTVAFGPAPEQTTRTETRFVSVSAGVPLSLVLFASEAAADVRSVSCVSSGDAPYPLQTYDPGSDLPDADFPSGCDDWGCDGFAYASESSCAAATIELSASDRTAGQVTRDYAVVAPVTSDLTEKPNEVFVPWANGTQPAETDLTSVTCED